MKFASRAVVGLVAALSFTVAIAEEAVPSNTEVRYVIARADGTGVPAPLPIAESALDAYAGRYDAAVGVAFVVDREGDSLTIELPQQFGGAPMRLHAAETRNAFTAEDAVRVVFESDANGRVLGLLLYASSNEDCSQQSATAPRHRRCDLRDDASSRSPLERPGPSSSWRIAGRHAPGISRGGTTAGSLAPRIARRACQTSETRVRG
jgi:hypothetical protein